MLRTSKEKHEEDNILKVPEFLSEEYFKKTHSTYTAMPKLKEGLRQTLTGSLSGGLGVEDGERVVGV